HRDRDRDEPGRGRAGARARPGPARALVRRQPRADRPPAAPRLMDVGIEGLRFAREDRVVLEVPSLRIRGGRTTAVLGPNGAGKTTLLRLLAALERPQAGVLRIGERAVRPDLATRHAVAFVFQEPVFLAR